MTLQDQSDSYAQARSNAMETIEGSISELGQIFAQLASLVSEQGEMITRFVSIYCFLCSHGDDGAAFNASLSCSRPTFSLMQRHASVFTTTLLVSSVTARMSNHLLCSYEGVCSEHHTFYFLEIFRLLSI